LAPASAGRLAREWAGPANPPRNAAQPCGRGAGELSRAGAARRRPLCALQNNKCPLSSLIQSGGFRSGRSCSPTAAQEHTHELTPTHCVWGRSLLGGCGGGGGGGGGGGRARRKKSLQLFSLGPSPVTCDCGRGTFLESSGPSEWAAVCWRPRPDSRARHAGATGASLWLQEAVLKGKKSTGSLGLFLRPSAKKGPAPSPFGADHFCRAAKPAAPLGRPRCLWARAAAGPFVQPIEWAMGAPLLLGGPNSSRANEPS